MLRDVYLHGAAGRAIGRHWQLDVESPAEAIRALMALRPQVTAALRAGFWRIVVGPPRLRYAIEPGLLHMQAGEQAIHIVPAQPPSGGDDTLTNVGKIVIGVALVAFAIWNPFAWGAVAIGAIASVGLSLSFGGAAGLLTPHMSRDPSQATDQARPDDRPSFFFNGTTNNTQAGGPVPVVMGTHLVGSTLVAGSVNTEDIAP